MTNFTAVQSASGTAGAAANVTFGSPITAGVPIRYAYVAIENTGTTGVIYARTDGGTATASSDNTVAVPPGQTVVMANAAPLWTQAANVIPKGTEVGAAGTGTPPEITAPYGSSLYGQLVSPGTTVNIFSAGTPTYTVSGTG